MTPAVATAKKAKIQFTLHEYDHDPAVRSFGMEAAEKLGVAPSLLFKTLVVSLGGRDLAVAVVPVAGHLDLKAVAKAFGVKKAAMADKKIVEKTTGYLTGGVSPMVRAEAISRSQWRSMSGVTPSKARAPSNTIEDIQEAWVIGPRMGGLPSCQAPSM